MILSIRNLSIYRGNLAILNDISWSIHPGQHWVILGANGSGKTSLLSSICGYLSPTTGECSVLGQTFGESDWRELRTPIGLVSSSIRSHIPDDEPAFITVLSGLSAILGFTDRPRPHQVRLALDLLSQVESSHLANRPWSVLSQGERQRVLIARALIAQPPLMILDEPCAGLDPIARLRFLEFIQRLGSDRNAPSLIFVTHHVEEIVPVFTHALLLRAGTVFAAGPREDVLLSKNLCATFDAEVTLHKRNGIYRLIAHPSQPK